MPNPLSLTVDRDVAVTLSDGTKLYADVVRPADNDRHPTLLQRTPYDKSGPNLAASYILRMASAGYAVVVQDVRGRFASEGTFDPFVNERRDGYETLDWLAGQPWSNGQIGMFGGSYVGLTQWQAALSGHPALKAIIPVVTATDYHAGWAYQGGAFELSFNLSWTLTNLSPNVVARARGTDPGAEAAMQTLLNRIDDMTPEFERLPLGGDALLARYGAWYDRWLAHPTYDDFWANLDIGRGHSTVSVAALNVGGWYDIFQDGTINNFAGVRANGLPDVRGRQHLLIGPWNHGGAARGNPIGEVDFGIRSTGVMIDLEGIQLRWYDRWLRGNDNGVDRDPPVRLFVMGINQWRTEQEWPLARTDWQSWHLHSAGRANSLNGDGALSRDAAGSEPPDAYISNPRHPVPTCGGGLCCNAIFSHGGAYDQRQIEAREDVLVYSSGPLAEPVEVTGKVKLILYASSSAVDCDFTAKLVDVCPCGCVRNLSDGILRARYRRSMREATLLTPGEIAEYEIDLWSTSNVFLKGHQIRLEVASSNFPRFDRNPQTGEEPGTATRVATAHQQVFHSAEYPSRLILPVIPAQ